MLTVAVGTGCGGGTSRLSAPAYVHRVGEICAAANRELGQIDLVPLGDGPAGVRALTRVVVLRRGSIEQLRSVRPPNRVAGAHQSWVALLDQSTDELEIVRAALQHHHAARAARYAAEAATLSARARALAVKLGVVSCIGPTIVTR